MLEALISIKFRIYEIERALGYPIIKKTNNLLQRINILNYLNCPPKGLRK